MYKPHSRSCMLDAAARTTGIASFSLLTALEHDGRKNGFDIQEIIEVLSYWNYNLVPIERNPYVMNPITCETRVIQFDGGNDERLVRHMWDRKGIVTGVNADGLPHAMAWMKEKAFNVNGAGVPLIDRTDMRIINEQFFNIREFWKLL